MANNEQDENRDRPLKDEASGSEQESGGIPGHEPNPVDLTRRAILKASWTVPLILAATPSLSAAASAPGHSDQVGFCDGNHIDHNDGSVTHADQPHFDHGDGVHSDVPHQDVSHTDGPGYHGDMTVGPHVDHNDGFHGDFHGDHADHTDVPHGDHSDCHNDAPHGDHNDGFHSDAHADQHGDHGRFGGKPELPR